MADESGRFADLVKLRLRDRPYLSEADAQVLLLDAVELGFSLAEAQARLAGALAEHRVRRESAIERVVADHLAIAAGNRGWISRTQFRHAAQLYRRLSRGGIGDAESRIRVKRAMLDHRWIVRGEAIFGTPHWFRAIPASLDRTEK